jgi:tetratricopeptide (TPR) repeat protein
MAKEGLRAILCAGALLGALCPLSAAGEDTVAGTLAVQAALRQGREQMARGNYQAAVYALEGQLSRINGSREYLAALRDAYRGYVKELRQANQEAEAQIYLRRLLTLDPGAILDFPPRGASSEPKSPVMPAALPARPAVGEAVTPAPTVRLQGDDNPFSEFHARQSKAQALVEQAEREFAGRRYEEAARLFEQAHQADPNSTAACGERWGYCKLYQVVQQLNQPPRGGPAYPELEQEVRRAMSLAPRLEGFGQDILRKIAERRAAGSVPSPGGAAPAVTVRHLERAADGWQVAETANFRIYHNQSRDFVERVAAVAERTRAEMAQKWLGEVGETWNPRCDLVLHATAQDYSRATHVPASSPGHSTMQLDGGRVLSRRIDLHCDDPNLLTAVLPHETTHVVLAGKFGDRPVPRWVDEGVAVLTEPRDKVERHLVKLPQYRQERQLFSLRQLMQLNDYPDPRQIGVFYAQSVSLVEFLAGAKGPQTFIRFVREGMRTGYEAALKRYYGYQDFNELEQHWRQHAFKEGAVPTGVAERLR